MTIDKTSGLPSNSVYDIYQDSRGFMWFATSKGLSRYDGNFFKSFSTDFQTSKAGSCIVEDLFGRIWYANFDGFLYYVENENLKALPQKMSLGYFRFGILKDELFLIQPNAVLVYDLKTLKVKNSFSISDNQIRFCYANSNRFYVLGDFLYEFGNQKLFKKHTLPKNFYNDIVGPLLMNWNQKLLINSKTSNVYYTFENNTFYKSKLNNSVEFKQNTNITDDDLWICTPNGVLKNELISKDFKTYFPDHNVSYVFKDKHHNYWISTLNKGVLFVQDFSNNYIDLQTKPKVLALGKNEIFIGAEKDAVYKLNLTNFKNETIFESNSNHSINHIFADTINDKLFFNSFNFKILNNKNQLTHEQTIAIKNIKKVDEKYFSFAASGLSGIFYENKNLKSSWDNLFEKNKENKLSKFNIAFVLSNTNGKSTAYNPINNSIYYATNNGLVAVTKNGETKNLKFKEEILYLTTIQLYKNEIIGLSTSEKFYVINSKNEVSLLKLPTFLANEKFSRFFIRKQFCYLFSEKSIFEFDLDTKKTQKVMSLNNDIEVTDVVLKNNKLFFATSKGIVIKNRAKENNFPTPKLIINEIHVNGKNVEVEKLKKLNPNENEISIHFSTITFIPNERYTICYKINNSEWKSLDSNDRNLKLFSLSSGKYTIQLAINHQNSKIDVQTIPFEITKPFWLQPLFLIGFGVVFLFVMYSIYKLQIIKLKKRNQLLLDKVNLEKNLNQSKLKAIKSQMNPHFFYNALNTLQSYILSNEKKQAVEYLSKFSNLTRTILESTEKEFVNINEEIKTLELYLEIEKSRFEKEFSYVINVEKTIDIDNIKIPTMLLQPYVENAVKHGLLHKEGLKKVEINFEKVENSLKISIDDNGIGRKKSEELNAIKNKNHISFATKAMQNRIELLNEFTNTTSTISIIDKTNQQGKPTGTLVILMIPISY